MLLSKACEYGLRAALYLAVVPAGTNVPIRSVSEALGLPYPFLAKIVQTLAQQGVVVSTRGAAGGIALARPARDITMLSIIRAVDGDEVLTQCVLGLPGCGAQKPCPLHAQWAATRASIIEMFEHATLAEMAERIQAGDVRLATPARPS